MIMIIKRARQVHLRRQHMLIRPLLVPTRVRLSPLASCSYRCAPTRHHQEPTTNKGQPSESGANNRQQLPSCLQAAGQVQ